MCIYIYRSIFMFWLTSPVSLYNDTRSIMKHTLWHTLQHSMPHTATHTATHSCLSITTYDA